MSKSDVNQGVCPEVNETLLYYTEVITRKYITLNKFQDDVSLSSNKFTYSITFPLIPTRTVAPSLTLTLYWCAKEEDMNAKNKKQTLIIDATLKSFWEEILLYYLISTITSVLYILLWIKGNRPIIFIWALQYIYLFSH